MSRVYIFRLIFSFVACVLVSSYATAQQQTTDKNHLNYCVDEQALGERLEHLKREKSVKTLKFISSAIERRAIAVDVSGYSEPILGHYSLPIKLRSLKSKPYLESEKLVIVGDGFDDEFLANTAYELEIDGFRDVKVLENGRRSRFLSNLNEKASVSNSGELHFVSATRALSTAAVSNHENEYHFLIWGGDMPQLKNYGISYSVIADSDYISGLKQLEVELSKTLGVNKRAKLVLVLGDSNQKNYVRGNDLMIGTRSLWVLEGGVSSLARAIENTKVTPLKLRNHKFLCRTR